MREKAQFIDTEFPTIYTMKNIKVKRNTAKYLADSYLLRYTYEVHSSNSQRFMQYKIPIQIENEDTIVAGLSLRQLAIMMLW